MQMVHLEEKGTNEEEGINGEDPDGIEGMTGEFIVHHTRVVKDFNRQRSIVISVIA